MATLSAALEQVSSLEDELASRDERIRRLRRYIPPVVAEGILDDQERLRGERREVTILFVDAVDFTRLSVSLDAESVFNLINDLLSRLVACVHRYGGLVDKFTGDGLMAVFGAPIAHENDAEIAVRAALDMQRAATEFAPIARAQLGAPIQIRIGINRGPAIAGVLGTDEQAAYTVIGETVNLASRLESIAQPGHILVSAEVYNRARPFFDFASRQLVSVKGVDQPVAVYEAVSTRASPGASRGVPGMTEVYLGRDPELTKLRDTFESFISEHQGQFVVVSGEAGMGKSRLVSEWTSRLDTSDLRIWRGRGLPYAQGTGYGVFRSLLQDALEAYATEDTWERRVSATFRPFIRRLLGLSLATDEETALEQLAPERISQLTTLAIREWLLHEAQEGPLMLILDDFHWADDLSRDVLQSVAGLVTEAHILVCVLTRPQPDFELDNPELEEARYQKIEIPPLSDKVSRKLLGTFVDLEGFPATTIDTILTRAEGNPFYIEEFVRMLIEKEVLELRESKWQVTSSPALESLDFPTSLRGLMLARVDRLPENLRYLLQDAAVVGLQFDAALLQEVEHRIRGLENILPAIERLKELDLLELRPQAGHSTYAFRHILTQETVYQSILRNERPELHKVVAESVETLYAYSKTEHAEVLALHYDRARIRDKALKYTLLSGKRAQRRFANREAIEYYSRALQLSQHLGRAQKERWQAAIGLGDVQQHLGEYEDAIAFYEAALEEHQESTPSERAEVQLQLGSVWQKLGDLENAESWLKTAATEIGEAEDVSPALEAEIYSALGWLTLRGGDLPTALALLQRALNLVDGTRHYQALSSILNRVGAVYYSQGEWDKATQTVQRSLEIRERLGDLLGVARSSNNLGILKRDSGDWPGALQTYQRSLEAMETIGDMEGIAIARTNIGNVYIDLGEWEKAERNLKTAYEIAQQIANPYEKAQANLNLGRLYFRKGEWERAGPFLDTAISLYAQAGVTANPNLMDTYWLRSMLYLEQGAIDEATTWGDRNLALLREGTGEEDGESPEWGRYHQLVGRLELAKGRVAPALEHLERAKRIFQENRSYAEVGRTAYWAAQAQLRADRSGQARDELQQARAVFEKLGAKFELSRVQRVLAGLEKATN